MKKKKILAIQAVALLLGTILASSISAEKINIESIQDGEDKNVLDNPKSNKGILLEKSDLIITDIVFVYDIFYPTFYAVVKNNGNGIIHDSIDVKVTVKKLGFSGIIIESFSGWSRPGVGLLPNEEIEIPIVYVNSLNSIGLFKFNTVVDPNDKIDEVNESNNNFSCYFILGLGGWKAIKIENKRSTNKQIIDVFKCKCSECKKSTMDPDKGTILVEIIGKEEGIKDATVICKSEINKYDAGLTVEKNPWDQKYYAVFYGVPIPDEYTITVNPVVEDYHGSSKIFTFSSTNEPYPVMNKKLFVFKNLDKQKSKQFFSTPLLSKLLERIFNL